MSPTGLLPTTDFAYARTASSRTYYEYGSVTLLLCALTEATRSTGITARRGRPCVSLQHKAVVDYRRRATFFYRESVLRAAIHWQFTVQTILADTTVLPLATTTTTTTAVTVILPVRLMFCEIEIKIVPHTHN